LLNQDEFAQVFDEITKEYLDCMQKQMDGSVTRGVSIEYFGIYAVGINTGAVMFDGFKGHSCGLGTSKISIDVDGNVFPCKMLHQSELQIGNAIGENFQQLYQRAQQKYSLMHTQGLNECQDCYVVNFCNKGCRASRYYTDGVINKKDILCKTIYKNIETVLWETRPI
jgi:radical SAM protein with 4Fe4S-binding SPASM domain